RGSLQQFQLLTKECRTLFRHGLNQVFQHGPQAAGDLDAGAAELTNFGDGQLDEILPVRGAVEEPEPAPFVSYPLVVQVPLADVAEEVVDLVQGQDRSGRVVDGGGKPLVGDVHKDAEGKGRVLLQGPFLAHGDRLVEGLGRQGCSTAENAEQGVADRDEVAD